MTELSGDPVEQLAARRDGQATPQPASEFYAPPAPVDLGDPALDPPLTVRVERWEDRLRTDVRRAVKTDDDDGWPFRWVTVAGGAGPLKSWLTDDDVRTWPVCPAVVNEAAYHLAQQQGPREGLVQPAERGDMDVDAFADKPRRAR